MAALAIVAAGCSEPAEPPVPTTVTVTPATVQLWAVGRTRQLTAAVRDQNGNPMSGVDVDWNASLPFIATVSTTGLVTAVGNGLTEITVTAGSATTEVPVTVAQVPATILVSPDSTVLQQPGDTALLAVAVSDSAGHAVTSSPALVWSSSDTTIAGVSATGRVTAVATGTATITATHGLASDQVTVRVVPQLTLVAAGPTTLSGTVDTQVTLSTRVRDLLGVGYVGATVTWSVDPGSGSIASTAQSTSGPGGFTAAVWQLGPTSGVQRATASLTSRGATVEVDFTANALPGAAVSASMTADSVLLSARGETVFLGPTYRDAHQNVTSAAGIAWTSRAPSVATVAADGLVTGQTAGATYVIATMAASVDSILVTVAMRGAITITFDDGFLTAYTNAWPVLQEFDLPANVGVNPAQVGFPAYMTKTMLDELHAAGWSIVSHSMTHDSLPSLSIGELDWELRASKLWIEAQGYNGSNVFIVPFHSWGARERDAVGSYYEAARGTSASAVVPDSVVTWRPSNPYNLTGIDADALPYTTPQGRDRLRALLQRTASEGAFLDVYLHHLPPENVQAFRDMLDVIDDFRERVLPYHELYARAARVVH